MSTFQAESFFFSKQNFFQEKTKSKTAGENTETLSKVTVPATTESNHGSLAYDLDTTKPLQEFSMIPRKLPRQSENPELQEGLRHDRGETVSRASQQDELGQEHSC